MDRQIVYPGAIPLDTDVLSIQRNTMVAVGYLAQLALGVNVVADGLACTPTEPPTMAIAVGPGSVTQFGSVDGLPFGSLPAEPGEPLLQMGVNLLSTNFQLTAPTMVGQAINYLVEASLLELDTTPVVLPYYNASNPGQPYSGPNNSGAAQNTQRLQQVQLQVKVGAPAPNGSQQTPPVDAGWVGLYVITVSANSATVVAGDIMQLPSAPFLTWKLPQLSPGTHNLAMFTPTTQGLWTVPNGVTTVKVRVWGGGGAGGAGLAGAGGGGAGGGYSEGFYAVSPGQSFSVTVGNGGVGSGTAGGNSSFGALAGATGGQAGASGVSGGVSAGGSTGGVGQGSTLVVAGQPGGYGLDVNGLALGGAGGSAFGGSGALQVATTGSAVAGASCVAIGGGGGGGALSDLGGQGGPGLILVEW